MKKIFTLASILALTPFLAFAQSSSCGGGLPGMVCRVNDVLDAILPLLLALGVIYFVWGVVQYFIGDSEEAKTKGRDRIIYGIIGLVVIVGLWGIVTLVGETFIGDAGVAPNLSTLSVAQNNKNTGAGCNGLLTNQPKFQNLLGYVTCIINDSVIPLIFALALALFIWGAVKFFIISSGEEEARKQGKQFMLWGIIALAVMLSVWGLVGILRNTFNVDTGGSVLPQVKPNQ